MMKKIGKNLYILILVCFIFNITKSHEIIITDSAGNQIKKPKALEIFTLLIKDNSPRFQNYLTIKGLENFNIVSKQVNNENNQTTYVLDLIANSEGQYLIKVKSGNSREFNDVVINVEKAEIELLISSDLQEAFIGQKIPIKTKFIYPDNQKIDLDQVIIPKIENVKFTFNPKLNKYQEVINGKNYRIVEQDGYFYPEKAGELIIKDFYARFTKRLGNNYRSSKGLGSFFDNFFGVINTNNKVTFNLDGNNIKLNILALPKSDIPVNAIGKFNKFNILLDKDKLYQNEAICLTVSISGDTNFEKLEPIELSLPDKFKVFDSKTSLGIENNEQVKKFEYILQPLEAGDFEIPVQNFTYFDIEEKKYKTLSTKALIIKVEPKIIPNTEISSKTTEKIDSFLKQNLKQNNRQIKMAWSIFFTLFLMPLILLIINSRSKLYNYYKQNLKYKFFTKLILKEAKTKIHKINKNKKPQELYQVLINSLSIYLTQYLTGNNKILSSQELTRLMLKLNFNKNIIDKFEQVIREILCYTNYNLIKKTETDNQEIFSKTIELLDLIETEISNKISKNYFKKSLKFILLVSNLNFFIFSMSDLSPDLSKNNKINNIIELYKIQNYATSTDKIKINKLINSDKNSLGITANNKEKTSLYDFIYFIINYLPLLAWQIIFLLFWLILIFSLIFNISFIKKLVIMFFVIITAVPISLIAYEHAKIKAVIKEQKAEIYLGPDESYPKKDNLELLDCIQIVKRQNSWYYIISCTNKGWIESKNLEIIS